MPDFRADIGVVLAATGSFCAKPPDELLMHYPTNFLSGSATPKPREDRAHLWSIFIRVGLEVDADRIVAEK
jgi:hypothetical protein